MRSSPHGRKRTRKSSHRRSSGMKGYSRYGGQGKGLSDRGQRSYNARKRASLSSGYAKYLFDVEAMLVPGTNQLKGMYQLPGSPKYAGGLGSFEREGGVMSHTQVKRLVGRSIQSKTARSGFGRMSTGYGGRSFRGLPAQIRNMLMGEGSELGKPPEAKGGGGLGSLGIGLIIAKVLL